MSSSQAVLQKKTEPNMVMLNVLGSNCLTWGLFLQIPNKPPRQWMPAMVTSRCQCFSLILTTITD